MNGLIKFIKLSITFDAKIISGFIWNDSRISRFVIKALQVIVRVELINNQGSSPPKRKT